MGWLTSSMKLPLGMRHALQHFHGRLLPGCSYIGCTNLTGFGEELSPSRSCSWIWRTRYCSVSGQQAAWSAGRHFNECGKGKWSEAGWEHEVLADSKTWKKIALCIFSPCLYSDAHTVSGNRLDWPIEVFVRIWHDLKLSGSDAVSHPLVGMIGGHLRSNQVIYLFTNSAGSCLALIA